MSASTPRHFSAARLREAQSASGFKNEDLAARVGVKLRLLQKWRAGTVAPSGANLIALSQALGQAPDTFYVETEAAA